MTIATILGARPQFIKAATVSRALRQRAALREVIIHTGQHYDPNMSDVFFQELALPAPDVQLGIGSAPHGEQTGRMLGAIEGALLDIRPQLALVYGDTNSTLAGALAAAKLGIPVAHVEAGLRSFRRSMPEEVNRIVADQLADLLLAPTATAVTNLAREGIPTERVHLVGDVMYDACRHYADLAADRTDQVLARFDLAAGGYLLATVHRQENTDSPERLGTVFAALGQIAAEAVVVLPLHPRTRRMLERAHIEPQPLGLRCIDPVGYLDMMVLERNARLIVTDSGGVQKEAFFHHVPCVTLRAETEWVELVEAGWNRLAPPVSAAAIVDSIRDSLARSPPPPAPALTAGNAASQIADILEAWLHR